MTINDKIKYTPCTAYTTRNLKYPDNKEIQGRKANRLPPSLWFWFVCCAAVFIAALLWFMLWPKDAQGDTPIDTATIHATVQVEQPIKDGTLLEAIAYCESKNDYGAQNPRSTAYGRYQITRDTFADANKALGGLLDIQNPTDQDLAAQWLINTRGTRPWISTKGCWNNH